MDFDADGALAWDKFYYADRILFALKGSHPDGLTQNRSQWPNLQSHRSKIDPR
jgi:hypothetical protein